MRIGYNGEWFVLAENEGGRKFWGWYNVPDSADQAFTEINDSYRKNTASEIRDVAFLPNGGYVIVYGRNDYYAENMPNEPLGVLKMLRDGGYEISQVMFGPEDSWIIRANGTW